MRYSVWSSPRGLNKFDCLEGQFHSAKDAMAYIAHYRNKVGHIGAAKEYRVSKNFV